MVSFKNLNFFREKLSEVGRFQQKQANEIQMDKPEDCYQKDDNVYFLAGPSELMVLKASNVEKIAF